MVSHQSDATIGAGNSSYLVSFPAKFIKGLPQCAFQKKAPKPVQKRNYTKQEATTNDLFGSIETLKFPPPPERAGGAIAP